MKTIVNNQRITFLVEKNAGTAFHLLVGSNDRGMVYFVCEQAPLLTLKSYGLPVRCPICRTENPLNAACL
jgi:hypothetical protein